MSQIQERIAKLLALADSPNEHEAQAALLKARELMAEYKLRPEEIQATGKAKVIVKTVGITCTAMTDSWVGPHTRYQELSAQVFEYDAQTRQGYGIHGISSFLTKSCSD